MSKENILIFLGFVGFISLFILAIIFGGWEISAIENETFVEYLRNGISKIISNFKYTVSRIY